MKLSEYAKQNSITYRTAQNHWKNGLIKGKQLPTGTIVVFEDIVPTINDNNVVLYARVSSSENKVNLETQLERLRNYACARGYTIIKEVKEIGSGFNDKRPLLQALIERDDWSKIIVEHKDRFARFGINYIQVLLNKNNKKLEIINETETDNEDLIQDFISIITSYCARIYGKRRSKRKTEEIIKTLESNEKN